MSKGKGKNFEKRKGILFELIKQLIPFIVIFIILFVISGGLYIIIEANNPDPEQTIGEFLFVLLMNGIMVLGLMCSYNSSKIKYDRSKSRTLMTVGIVLFVLGWLGSSYLADLRGDYNIFYWLRAFFSMLK